MILLNAAAQPVALVDVADALLMSYSAPAMSLSIDRLIRTSIKRVNAISSRAPARSFMQKDSPSSTISLAWTAS